MRDEGFHFRTLDFLLPFRFAECSACETERYPSSMGVTLPSFDFFHIAAIANPFRAERRQTLFDIPVKVLRRPMDRSCRKRAPARSLQFRRSSFSSARARFRGTAHEDRHVVCRQRKLCGCWATCSRCRWLRLSWRRFQSRGQRPQLQHQKISLFVLIKKQ